MEMKKEKFHLAVFVMVFLSAFSGSAETVALRAFETGRAHVTEAATPDHATLGGSVTLVKDGAGTLNVNLSKVPARSSPS